MNSSVLPVAATSCYFYHLLQNFNKCLLENGNRLSLQVFFFEKTKYLHLHLSYYLDVSFGAVFQKKYWFMELRMEVNLRLALQLLSS